MKDYIFEMSFSSSIIEKLDDKDQYQTVFSREISSETISTSGFYFSLGLLSELRVYDDIFFGWKGVYYRCLTVGDSGALSLLILTKLP